MEEEEDSTKKTLDAINQKFKDNLALRSKLLALHHYSQIESKNTEQMEKEMDTLSLKYKKLTLPLINKVSQISFSISDDFIL